VKEKWERMDDDLPFPISKKDMVEFYEDGRKILDYFSKNRSKYFNVKETDLVGIEDPIDEKVGEGVVMIGFLDVVLRDKDTGDYKIVDIKTSTKGWNSYKKKDKLLTDQLVAYKHYYSERLGVDPDRMSVEYLILKRKLNENAPYKPPRFQRFSPSSGSRSRSRVISEVDAFLEDAFDESGNKRRDKKYEKKPEKFKCAFCVFSKQHGDVPICDQDGHEFHDYPDSMADYIDPKYCGPQPKLND
jgi:hypothetical protein